MPAGIHILPAKTKEGTALETARNESMQASVSSRLNTTTKHTFSLQMAPMIDVVFLLIIFFIVAAKWRPEEHSLPFQLPVAQAADHAIARPEPLVIHIFATETGCQLQISRSDAIQIEERSVEADLVTLMEKMKKCLLAQKRFAGDPVEIVCDAKVKWEYLAKIYNVFFGAGLTDITFAMTEQPDNGHFD